MHVYVCIYIYIYIHTYIRVELRIHKCTPIDVCVCAYTDADDAAYTDPASQTGWGHSRTCVYTHVCIYT